jgi:hypothetical protein
MILRTTKMVGRRYESLDKDFLGVAALLFQNREHS